MTNEMVKLLGDAVDGILEDTAEDIQTIAAIAVSANIKRLVEGRVRELMEDPEILAKIDAKILEVIKCK